jgi:hypothetical protein
VRIGLLENRSHNAALSLTFIPRNERLQTRLNFRGKEWRTFAVLCNSVEENLFLSDVRSVKYGLNSSWESQKLEFSFC